MVMARELYALLTPSAFRLPNDPSNTMVYTHPTLVGQPIGNTPLTQTEQATINMPFVHEKHYFILMRIIERACFTALNARVNDIFKVSNDPGIQC
jgi:hypothetical protein